MDPAPPSCKRKTRQRMATHTHTHTYISHDDDCDEVTRKQNRQMQSEDQNSLTINQNNGSILKCKQLYFSTSEDSDL